VAVFEKKRQIWEGTMSIMNYPTLLSQENIERWQRKQQILVRIEKLQQTRDYADEVESARLTKVIGRLLRELDELA